MWRKIALAIALVLPATAALADTTVTLCSSDDQTGPGTNFASAVAAGGKINFACGPGATILMNCHHEIIADTEIDGGGAVTLKANASGPGCSIFGSVHYALFHNKPAQTFSFRLNDLNVVGVKPDPQSSTSQLRGQFVTGNLKLTVTNSKITGWTSPVGLNQGLTILDNTALSDNDGVVVGGPNLTVRNNSVFTGNEGTPMEAQGGPVVIADSQFSSNKIGSKLSQCSTIDIRNSKFDSNSDPDVGGALTTGCNARISGTVFTNNHARSGGALYIGDTAAHINIIGGIFESNTAIEGGAISIRGEIYPPVPPSQDVELHGVTFKSNQAQFGGAVEFARFALPGIMMNKRALTMGGTQFVSNHATLVGGALVLAGADVTIDKVLFTSNKADRSGGGIAVMAGNDGKLTLSNSLLVKNIAPFGAAVAGQAFRLINSTVADNDGPGLSAAKTIPSLPIFVGPSSPQPILLQNTIIAGGSGPPCGLPDPAAPYVDVGHNLQSNGNGCGVSIPVSTPQFGPSYIPLPTSPAAHSGDDAVCAAAPISGRDIWDHARPYSGHCATGAAESNIDQMVKQASGSIVGIIRNLIRCACLRW